MNTDCGEGPSHIIVPAIHKDRRQVGKLFAEKLGGEYSDDPAVLTESPGIFSGKSFSPQMREYPAPTSLWQTQGA